MSQPSDITIDALFLDRWSSRSFDGSAISQEQQETLFKAACRAPSSFNEQPWRFILPEPDQYDAFFNLLHEGNRTWVQHAGLLCFIAAKRMLTKTGEENRFSAFDTGSAWMSLALQAQRMGLSAHAMGGFDVEQSYTVLGVDRNDYTVLAAIAVGVPTTEARATEERTDRKPLSDIIMRRDTMQ